MAAPQISEIDVLKKSLRRKMAEYRQGLSSENEEKLRGFLLKEILAQPARKIAAVWPLAEEVDLRPLCHALSEAGRQVLLPETTPKGSPLIFRRWTPSSSMIAGRFGTSHPEGEIEVPDLVLVPFLAFDRSGYRLGYGGGYYDRTLAALNVPAIGFGFAGQQIDAVPTGPYDIPLKTIVTEYGVLQTDNPKSL
ncbi:5-formyltetrahydrofolate cyclo-ligase [Gluconobacter kondonii]|uniref:5-formyltetrahydrofolate cyclo-ligase n=1 Tax=Gluconobacter kondonii TaxID=941463 RepID=UPI001B8AE8A3|nr:5-formyltetrahydrofolate cyclo-ligase [Gluconobacter kondonii]MBS1066896.1 5-formyltetrahydrofolate cyclo-ligase [Gluconobacter kondonii]MBS1081826.1 5-formyltetrahydrofolate cyclo-ligase [Gluconobacter kondonii]MBS1084564.1 5-formyltetrahydrofolate cyclo-ligase [Gluconobacter kondonii]